MHVFADASELGFAGVIYLRYVYLSDEVSCAFLVGKSRVAPLKPLTVPRLELQAVVLATARLSIAVQRELNVSVHEVFYWVDSLAVLQYIKNESRRFPTFVANRIAEICENTKPQEWHHVPGALNPADDGPEVCHHHNFCKNIVDCQNPNFFGNLRSTGRLSLNSRKLQTSTTNWKIPPPPPPPRSSCVKCDFPNNRSY